jgi:hypothetical protein
MPRQVPLHRFRAALAADNSPYRWRDHSQAVRNLVLSKAVPVTGIAEGESERQRIDHWVTLEAGIDVMLDRVSVVISRDPPRTIDGPLFHASLSPVTRRRCFEDVMIDEAAACEWLRKNAGSFPVRRTPGPKMKKAAFEAWWNAGGSNEGLLHGQIANKFDVDVRTVSNWLKDK